MGPDPIQELIQEDEKLAVGTTVTAHWVEDGCVRHCRGRITALQPRRVRVELVGLTNLPHGHHSGHTLELPRISDPSSWSSDQCVRVVPRS